MSKASREASLSVLERFTESTVWERFDEWTGICVEISSPTPSNQQIDYVCAFFGMDPKHDYKMTILRGPNPAQAYLKYRHEEWIPEFGLDFATSDSIQVYIDQGQVVQYESLKPGLAPQDLRADEKQLMFTVFEAIVELAQVLDQGKIALLDESNGVFYYLWKWDVADAKASWKIDIRETPVECYIPHPSIQPAESRLQRIKAVKLGQEGVWEAAYFYLPVTRVQGDQEVYVQCAGIADREKGLIGLVTLEAHADPDAELVEALLGSIEKQGKIPQFLIVKDEQAAEKLLPLLVSLNIHLRLRRNLYELESIREEMIEKFPDEE